MAGWEKLKGFGASLGSTQATSNNLNDLDQLWAAPKATLNPLIFHPPPKSGFSFVEVGRPAQQARPAHFEYLGSFFFTRKLIGSFFKTR